MKIIEGKKGLHNVSIVETERVFIQSGETEFAVWTDGNAFAERAAEFLVSQIALATGVRLNKETGEQILKKEKKQIVLCDKTTYEGLGFEMPKAEYGYSGYHIKTQGEKVYLCVNHRFGYQLAVLGFLSHVVGYVAYAPDTIKYQKAGETVYLPDMDIVEKADVDLRISGNNLTDPNGIYAMGYGDRWDYTMKLKQSPYHTSLLAVKLCGIDPKKEGFEDHPWLSDNKELAVRQLCYTAHGDEAELEKMITAVSNVIIEEMELPHNLEKTTFTLGVEDGWGQCTCPACTKEKEKYGTDTATTVKFFNRLSRKIQAHLQAKADQTGTEKRKFTLLFFGYKFTEEPPVKEVNGEIVPVDESVVCDENVGVFLAPIAAKYTYSFNHPVNKFHKDNLMNWTVLTKNIWFWTYQTNYLSLLYPNGIMRAFKENYQLCLDANVEFIYNQGAYFHMTSHFTPLKEYVDSRLSFDCSLDLDVLIDEFFENYFGAAAKPLRKMFDSIELYWKHLLVLYPEDCTGWIYNTINQAKLWPESLLKGYLSCVNEAFEAILPLKETDPETYDVLYKHVLRESIFPRFALLELYPDHFTQQDFKASTKAIKQDCETLGITRYGDQTQFMANYYKKWKLDT